MSFWSSPPKEIPKESPPPRMGYFEKEPATVVCDGCGHVVVKTRVQTVRYLPPTAGISELYCCDSCRKPYDSVLPGRYMGGGHFTESQYFKAEVPCDVHGKLLDTSLCPTCSAVPDTVPCDSQCMGD